MKTLIIVSKCLRVTNFGSGPKRYEFHFKGALAGSLVRKILLKGDPSHGITRGEDYLIWVRITSMEAGVLEGEILKLRRLEDCWDKS
jgi:hypothetical protein